MRAKVRGVLVGLASVLAISATVLGANASSADSIKYESYQRASQSEVCAAQAGETPWRSSWGSDPSWKPSWEQWANGGTGGWTCTRSITWAHDGVADDPYPVGSVGPGGGLVFLIDNGVHYEMAPKTWSGPTSLDTPALTWCDIDNSDVAGAVGTAIGTGSANTTAMQSPACASGAGVSARAYRGGGFANWFLPSRGEMFAMQKYSGSIIDWDTYGFSSAEYWSSSQFDSGLAWRHIFADGGAGTAWKGAANVRVRPIRASATTGSGGSPGSTYVVGDIGPGGGLVFLISGGLIYEMAPKTWSGPSSLDTPTLTWCDIDNSNIAGAVGTAIGTGSANTTAMQSPACASGAGAAARAYRGGGFSDWFLPSRGEMFAMQKYSGSIVDWDTYGFSSSTYWSSSQFDAGTAWRQFFSNGGAVTAVKGASAVRVRPIRAF
jgi:hypothetical protein